MMEVIKSWFHGLVELLSCERGDNSMTVEIDNPPKKGDNQDDGDDDDDLDLGDDDLEGDDDDLYDLEDDEDDDNSDEDDDDPNRSKTIPRKRFDQVNKWTKDVESMLANGVLAQDENGNLVVSPQAGTPKPKDKSNSDDVRGQFRFTKDEVAEESWPLVEKINKAYEYYDNVVGQAAYAIESLRAENAILRDYPEFLQKQHPLRKKAMSILKNDPEFKQAYKNNPAKAYWAVKRAAELLSGKKPPKKGAMKKKRSFIVGKGDPGKKGKKIVDLNTLSEADLDKLEQKEHQRIMGLKGKKK